jgi:hypothetical protein
MGQGAHRQWLPDQAGWRRARRISEPAVSEIWSYATDPRGMVVDPFFMGQHEDGLV